MVRYNRNPNPSFANNTTGWTSSGLSVALRRIASTRGDGTAGYIGDGNTTGATASISTTNTGGGLATVVAGQQYTVSVYVYQGSGSTKNVRVDVDQANASGTYTSTWGGSGPSVAVPTGTWTRISQTGTVSAGSARLSTYVAFSALTAGVYVGVSCAMVEDGASSPNYRDGGFSGWAWTGTAGSSSSYEVDVRSGIGVAALGHAARGSGSKVSTAPVRAALGHTARGSGPKAGTGTSRAALGHAPRGSGPKGGTGSGWTPAVGFTTRPSGAKGGVGSGWASKLGLGAFSSAPPPIPIFTGRPLAEDPLPMADGRYLVQNILTGEWLHTDLPLSDDQVTLTLSGPCEIAGSIKPEMADLKAPDGSPLLRSWGHVVYLEMDGEIRAAGLITEDSYDDQTQSLTCQGISAYPAVIPYQDSYRRYFADPLDVVAEMWSYVQSFSNGNLGVVVQRLAGLPAALLGAKVSLVAGDTIGGVKLAPTDSNNTSDDQPIVPVRRANTISAVFDSLVAMGFKNRAKIDPSKAATGDNVPPSDCIFVTKAGLEQAYSDYFMSSAAARTVAAPPDTTSSFTIEPFKIDWWDVKDCDGIISDAVKACPADFVEQYSWNFPHTFVDQSLLLAYPRAGRRRDDLRFVQGENIVSEPALDSDPDGYATCVIGIGAGEGSASLRETAEVIVPGRVRKTYVYRNAKITDRITLRRIVNDELAQRQLGGHEVVSVVVKASHENARFGEYNVGDDILTQTQIPHFGWLQQWGRIVSMTLARGSDLVEIKLRRSDSWFYGREVESS